MSGPMMGDLRVALRTGPSSVASLGRVTHAPADSTLYRAMMRGQLLHPSRAAPGFDGVGSIRHRSQNFLRRWWVGSGTFEVGLGRGRRVDLLVVHVPVIICDKFQQSVVHVNVEVPQIQFIDRNGGLFQCAPVTCTHSANCAEDR